MPDRFSPAFPRLAGIAAALGLCVLGLVSCTPDAREPVEEVRRIMGQLVRVEVWPTGRGNERELLAAAFAEMERLDHLLALDDPGSGLAEINRLASSTGAEADPSLLDLLLRSREWWDKTDGIFDPTMGPVLKLWGIPSGEGPGVYTPTMSGLEEARRLVGINRLVVNDIRGTIRFDMPGMALNFDSVKLGYALDRAADILTEGGIQTARLRAETVARYLGTAPSGEPWMHEVPHPRDPERLLTTIPVQSGAVAVLADHYTRFFVRSNQKYYTGVIHTETGMPVEDMVEVAVRAPDAFGAQVMAQTCFILGRSDGGPLLSKMDGVDAIFVYPKEGDPGAFHGGVSRGLRSEVSLDL